MKINVYTNDKKKLIIIAFYIKKNYKGYYIINTHSKIKPPKLKKIGLKKIISIIRANQIIKCSITEGEKLIYTEDTFFNEFEEILKILNKEYRLRESVVVEKEEVIWKQ